MTKCNNIHTFYVEIDCTVDHTVSVLNARIAQYLRYSFLNILPILYSPSLEHIN